MRGTTAAEWMAENGRLPAHVVLHIVREMVARLADLELLGVVHGDISASGLALQPAGNVVLPMPGLRGIVRPAEGYAFAELPPEAYDYLAPERIEEGSPPTLASDVYACTLVASADGSAAFRGRQHADEVKGRARGTMGRRCDSSRLTCPMHWLARSSCLWAQSGGTAGIEH